MVVYTALRTDNAGVEIHGKLVDKELKVKESFVFRSFNEPGAFLFNPIFAQTKTEDVIIWHQIKGYTQGFRSNKEYSSDWRDMYSYFDKLEGVFPRNICKFTSKCESVLEKISITKYDWNFRNDGSDVILTINEDLSQACEVRACPKEFRVLAYIRTNRGILLEKKTLPVLMSQKGHSTLGFSIFPSLLDEFINNDFCAQSPQKLVCRIHLIFEVPQSTTRREMGIVVEFFSNSTGKMFKMLVRSEHDQNSELFPWVKETAIYYGLLLAGAALGIIALIWIVRKRRKGAVSYQPVDEDQKSVQMTQSDLII